MMEQAHDPDQHMTERYFLGELTDDQAEAFEAHYFECPRCAKSVTDALAMMEGGRDAVRPDNVVPMPKPKPTPIPPRRRWDWPSAAVAAGLVLTVGAPFLIPNRPRPSVINVPPTPIQFSQERSTAAPALSFPAGSIITFDVEIPPDVADYPRFEVTVRDQSDEVVDKRYTFTAEQANEPVFLVLRELPAGTYNVVVEGVRENGSRSRVRHNKPFEVRG